MAVDERQVCQLGSNRQRWVVELAQHGSVEHKQWSMVNGV